MTRSLPESFDGYTLLALQSFLETVLLNKEISEVQWLEAQDRGWKEYHGRVVRATVHAVSRIGQDEADTRADMMRILDNRLHYSYTTDTWNLTTEILESVGALASD